MTNEYLTELKKKINNLSEEDKLERNKYLRDIALGKIYGPLTGYHSIDQTHLQYYDKVFSASDIPDKSIYQFAYDNNIKNNNMDNVAIDVRISANDFNEVYKVTYKEFFEMIDRNSKSSKMINIDVADIVPIILPNIIEARTLIYSNSKIGATSYPISPMLSSSVLNNIIMENKIKTIFIHSLFYDKFKMALNSSSVENIVLLGDIDRKSINDDRIIFWDEYNKLADSYTEDIIPYYNKNNIAVIIGTSGTTGTSKGVCLSDRNVNTCACAYMNGDLFNGVTLDALLPSIGYGISMIHFQTVSGKYVYLVPELLLDKFPRAIEKLQPQAFPGGPIHYINLVNSELYKNGKVPVGMEYISGGASLLSSVESCLNGVEKGYKEIGINDNLVVRQGFGISEDCAIGTYNKKGSYAFGSIGIPVPYVKMAVCKPGTDQELTYYELGELCISSPSVMQYYLNNEKETNNVLIKHSDGETYLHTGDIVYIDEFGHIFHKDRIKNIFMRKGFNVHPTKVAEYISSLPNVNNSCVIGFEHPSEQTVPVAFFESIENKFTQTDEMIQMIKDRCYKELEETSIPLDYVEVDSLPINAGGKIDLNKVKAESGIDYMSDEPKIKKRIRFIK